MEETIRFESPRQAQSIYADNPAHLKTIEETFGIRLTQRENWFRIEADTQEPVRRTIAFLNELSSAIACGMTIRDFEFNYTLTAFQKSPENEPCFNLQSLSDAKIDVSPRKPQIQARTHGQRQFVHAMQKSDLTFGIGPAGTGKTFLATAMAVSLLRSGHIERIVLTRPAVEAGEALGFLPGDLKEKLLPYLRPLYDALHAMMEPEEILRHTEKGTLEIAPLAYMRGRTLEHSFVILDEGQNTTPDQMLMFLTRLGRDSQCVVTGDITQIDLPSNKRSGLIEAERILKNVNGISFCHFHETDVVRHPLVQRIIRAYAEHQPKR